MRRPKEFFFFLENENSRNYASAVLLQKARECEAPYRPRFTRVRRLKRTVAVVSKNSPDSSITTLNVPSKKKTPYVYRPIKMRV